MYVCMVHKSKQGNTHTLALTPTCSSTYTHAHELIPMCDAMRRENVGALHSTVSGLLVISRAYPPFLSSVPQNIIDLSSSVAIVALNQEISRSLHVIHHVMPKCAEMGRGEAL